MPSLLLTIGNSSNVPRKEYVVDTTAEMNELKKEFGTLVLNLEDANFYMCNSQGEWVQISK